MRSVSCIARIFLYLFFVQTHAKTSRTEQDEEVLQEPHNIFRRDKDDLKVDLNIGEDDYSLVTITSPGDLLANKSNLFEEFDTMASKEYESLMERSRSNALLQDKSAESKVWSMFLTEIHNRTYTKLKSQYRRNQTKQTNTIDDKVIYNRLLRVSEYYYNTKDNNSIGFYDSVDFEHTKKATKRHQGLLKSIRVIVTFKTTNSCTDQDLDGIGIDAIRCLITEFIRKQIDFKYLAQNLWKIAVIWLAVYLAIAIPLWCAKGWCSCLCCKFFKPQQTIQEAKNYLLLNPPGVFITKKGEIINYEPTQRERDCYEEFGHFLRTL